MGAAGDMIASALIGLFDDREKAVAELNSLCLPDTYFSYLSRGQGGHLSVSVNGETETPDNTTHHHSSHRNLKEIYEIIEKLNISDKVKNDVKNIYSVIAEAEAKAHGEPVGEVHFHELGMLDAVADITACSFLLEKLGVDKIYCSPLNVGNGSVKCAHGVLPVPAPATAIILTGVPFYKSDIQTELCTPTGAAVLKYFSDEFINAPDFGSVKKIGVGYGVKELERENTIRVFLYEDNSVTELSCNIDDMTGEEASFAAEMMIKNGALDCFITPVFMKKGRPAYLFTVICNSPRSKEFASLIFKHTTTIGIRKYTPSRYKLDRTLVENGGAVIKRSEGFGETKEKIEFEDIKKYALEKDISVFQARKILEENIK
jgi:uncharacterized protein (TIGR00299 family) protein